MRILLLGTGYQGKAALYDLVHYADAEQIIAADLNLIDLQDFAATLPPAKLECVSVNAGDLDAVSPLMAQSDIVIAMLPPPMSTPLLPLAVEKGVHWIDASYPQDVHRIMADEALSNGVAILPEMGLDPGIDLLLAALVLAELDDIELFNSYGAGVPEPSAADNPLNYRISWTFEGVLKGYYRPARLVKDGLALSVPPREIFAPTNRHFVDLDQLGRLEAYPNGDAVRYLELLGLSGIVNAGRYSMRWPGHSDFWYRISNLGFLSNEAIKVDGKETIPLHFLRDLLEPQLQYDSNQRDVAIVLVEAVGKQDGAPCRITYQLIDFRDLESGFLAMQRTVGFSASIAAQMLAAGEITKRGLLSPLTDVPAHAFFQRLEQRGITYTRQSKRL